MCRYIEQQHLQPQQQQQHLQPLLRYHGQGGEHGGAENRSCTPAAAAGATSAAPVLDSDWGWQAAAYRSIQAALAMVHADALLQAREQLHAAGSSGASAAVLPTGSEDERPELLAALIERLPEAVPDVQLLVLPVLLPAGRCGTAGMLATA